MIFMPPREYDVKSVVLDISKARSALLWEPQVSLRDGCERYWRWLRSS
jgi:UDP-glucose 4-epimerase